jgi:hypothetical protein
MTALRVTAMVRRTKSKQEDRPMEPIYMPLTDIESDSDTDSGSDEELRVHAWRSEQLRELGLPRGLAELFADVVDWHSIAALVERGCPPSLALEIVA